MLKKLIVCAVSAVIAAASFTSFAVTAEDTVEEKPKVAISIHDHYPDMTYTDYVTGDNITVFDLIRIKRSLAAEDGEYSAESYKFIRDYLLRITDGRSKYAQKVAVSYETDGCSLEAYSNLKDIDTRYVYIGSTISMPFCGLKREGSSHNGWDFEGETYKQGATFVVPDHNVTFTPHWFNYHKLTYLTGDYDDVLGSNMATVQVTEGTYFDLADKSRFSRLGYTITGWECSLDGKIYGPYERYLIPDTDVTFTAVWEPASVEISLSAGNGKSIDKIKASGKTGEEFVLPECTFTNGDKTFAGWDYDGTIYQPGESFKVPPLMKGSRVVIVATWE